MKLTSKLKYFTLACGLIIGFASCSNDDDIKGTGGSTDDGGDPTTLQISISQPKSSYAAANDPNATVNEAKLETVDVYIYNSNGTLINHETLNSGNFTGPNYDNTGKKDKYTADVSIATTTGDRRIFVGVNLPSAISNAIAAAGNRSGLNNVYTIALSDITGGASGTDGFAMFSTGETQKTLVADATQNTVSVDVARLAAKVSVHEGTSLDLTDVGGGMISDLEFTIGNSNTKIYAFQQFNGTTVIDPNYEWTTSNNYDSDFVFLNNYMAVNPYTVANIDNLRAQYTPENTSRYYYERETTYASVKASFIPSYFYDGNDDVANGSSTAATFWAVKLTDGSIKYFDDENIALSYFQANSGSVINEYEDGLCYYTMFLNPKNKFNTIRNTYYKAVITAISGLGSHTPDVTNPVDPVTEPTNITVDINVLDWVVEEDEYELSL